MFGLGNSRYYILLPLSLSILCCESGSFDRLRFPFIKVLGNFVWISLFFSSFTFCFLFPFPPIRRQHSVNHWLLRDLISLANRFRERLYLFINYHLPLSTRNLELFLATHNNPLPPQAQTTPPHPDRH